MNTANLSKWVDELQGQIDQLKRAVAAAGGGDEVTITPALDSGTKIADFTIGEDTGALYAPTIPSIPDEFIIESGVEHKIGKYGNEDLYSKEIPISAFPSTAYTATNYPHGITDLKSVVFCAVYMTGANGISGFVPTIGATASGADPTTLFNANITSENIVIVVGRDRSTLSGKVIMFYTKNPPAPPEQTRKGGKSK